jgi:Sugar-transfer associated ATP-grasp
MAQRTITGVLQTLLGHGRIFFYRRCLTGFPWYWPARPAGLHAMVEARRTIRRHFGRDYDPVRRRLAQAFVAIAWPPAVLVNLLQVRHWLGPEEAALLPKRAPGALWTAIRHNILPSEYFAYGLWQRDHRINMDNYLYSNEAARLFKTLNRPSRRPDPIGDKLAFHEMCKAHAIPTPPVLAAFAPTDTLVGFESGRPPQHDLFIKVATGKGHTERLRWHAVDFESNRSFRIKPKDLGGYLAYRARTKNRTLLVQPVLSNHPDLRVEPNGALATARLVTGRSIDGEVTPVFCFILFGLASKITAHSNCVAMIDVTDGTFMPAPPQDRPGISMYQYRQFDSNDPRTLPDWNNALCYVKAAHKACSNFVFVGWDVAFTPHGAMLLEGNANWDAATYQTLRGEPLGHTKFADILATRLEESRSQI